MENTVVNELNTLLKGEHMAIDAYERYIREAREEKVAEEFRHIQQDHRTHADRIRSRIENLGGHAEGSTGFAGMMASAKATMESMAGMGTADLIKKAYDGEDKGIAKAEEIVKGDLDPESADLVQQILSVDHDHLSKMMHLLSDLGLH